MNFVPNVSARIGAVLYVLWSLLHLVAARGIYQLAATLPLGLANARLAQGAWDLAVFALQALVIAVLLNWRNNPIGYWCNVIVVGTVDLGFILLLIVPGYVPVSVAALAGPIIYVIAAGFSTAGHLSKKQLPAHS